MVQSLAHYTRPDVARLSEILYMQKDLHYVSVSISVMEVLCLLLDQ